MNDQNVSNFVSSWSDFRQNHGGNGVTAQDGYKYVKVVDSATGDALGFIEKATGNIFRAATQAAAATNKVRGNVLTEDGNPALVTSVLDGNGNIPMLKRGRPKKVIAQAEGEVETPVNVA